MVQEHVAVVAITSQKFVSRAQPVTTTGISDTAPCTISGAEATIQGGAEPTDICQNTLLS